MDATAGAVRATIQEAAKAYPPSPHGCIDLPCMVFRACPVLTTLQLLTHSSGSIYGTRSTCCSRHIRQASSVPHSCSTHCQLFSTLVSSSSALYTSLARPVLFSSHPAPQTHRACWGWGTGRNRKALATLKCTGSYIPQFGATTAPQIYSIVGVLFANLCFHLLFNRPCIFMDRVCPGQSGGNVTAVGDVGNDNDVSHHRCHGSSIGKLKVFTSTGKKKCPQSVCR